MPQSEITTPATPRRLKLNLGAGNVEIPGFVNIDRSTGDEAYPLPGYPDNSVEEIRASHILEHFSHRDTVAVLKEWCRVLRPGGRIRIGVPDLDKIIAWYQNGSPNGQDLWVADVESASARKLISDGVNSVYGSPFAWLADSKTLICKTVPEGTMQTPTAPTVPAGPIIQETAGRKAPARTYQDLLKN